MWSRLAKGRSSPYGRPWGTWPNLLKSIFPLANTSGMWLTSSFVALLDARHRLGIPALSLALTLGQILLDETDCPIAELWSFEPDAISGLANWMTLGISAPSAPRATLEWDE